MHCPNTIFIRWVAWDYCTAKHSYWGSRHSSPCFRSPAEPQSCASHRDQSSWSNAWEIAPLRQANNNNNKKKKKHIIRIPIRSIRLAQTVPWLAYGHWVSILHRSSKPNSWSAGRFWIWRECGRTRQGYATGKYNRIGWSNGVARKQKEATKTFTKV
jgi:hypothetical protein